MLSLTSSETKPASKPNQRCCNQPAPVPPKPTYQLDLTTPGISPFSASERKQRRQTPNLRRNARGRPQSWQRLCWRDLNFGFFASLTRFAVVAIVFALYLVTKSG